MPKLVINGDQHDILSVYATMLFPNDEKLRNQYIFMDQISKEVQLPTVIPPKNNRS